MLMNLHTWMAVRAATIAGDPNPWEINEKCVKWRCMDGSNKCWGLVLHKGERSWFSKSISSFVIYNKYIDLLQSIWKNKS